MVATSSLGTALITGASSGIGAVFADRLAAQGYDLILVARNTDRLNEQVERLRKHGHSTRAIGADLATAEGVKTIAEVLKSDQTITTLINNAGFGAVGPLVASDIDLMSEMIDVNVTAVTKLTYALVPQLLARGTGTIINVASIVAIAPEILNGVYGATKAFVLAFSQSLRKELADKGIRVHVVVPGPTATGFWTVADYPHTNFPADWVMSADDLVDAALSGLHAGEFVTIPGLQDVTQWETYETARQAMMPNLARSKPAPRYAA